MTILTQEQTKHICDRVLSFSKADECIVTVNGSIIAPTPYLTVPGAVTITTSATSATGTIQWDITYVPLDAGAQVAAA